MVRRAPVYYLPEVHACVLREQVLVKVVVVEDRRQLQFLAVVTN